MDREPATTKGVWKHAPQGEFKVQNIFYIYINQMQKIHKQNEWVFIGMLRVGLLDQQTFNVKL